MLQRRFNYITILRYSNKKLKEYYEIVNEDRPLAGLFPTDADFLQKCISNHESKQSSKFQSDPSSNCFTIDV